MISWPTTVVLVALILSASILGATHVITADWIERTFSAILGFAAGHALGVFRRRGGSDPPPPPATPRS